MEQKKSMEFEDTDITYALINAFTDHASGGNPAAVCYLPHEKDDKWLQQIAREFNQPMTAFLVHRDANAESEQYDLRWFTSKAEVDFCGHATLASAHLLFTLGIVTGNTVRFHTRAGVLIASKVSGYKECEDELSSSMQKTWKVLDKKRLNGKGVVELDFPLVPAIPCNDSALLSAALDGATLNWVGETALGDYLVELPSSADVENLKPQFHKMLDFHGRGSIFATALASEHSEHDVISRVFCPKMGIPEDSATGSAHCTIGQYWATKLGKNELKAFQASERGGKMLVRVDKDVGRVYLQAQAVVVMAGALPTAKG